MLPNRGIDNTCAGRESPCRPPEAFETAAIRSVSLQRLAAPALYESDSLLAFNRPFSTGDAKTTTPLTCS